jgi:tRNA(fMet)-specific endonuclease VapC
MKRVLLDTNAYTALLRGNEDVLGAIGEAETVYASVVVIGELLAGFRGGSRPQENNQLLQQFLERPTVTTLDITGETAEFFAEVKHRLRQAGTPLPINDVWLAAQAMEAGAVLISHDRHFRAVAGLRVWPGP